MINLLTDSALLQTIYEGRLISEEVIKCRVEDVVYSNTAKLLYTDSYVIENSEIRYKKTSYAVIKVIPYFQNGVVFYCCSLTKIEKFIVSWKYTYGLFDFH